MTILLYLLLTLNIATYTPDNLTDEILINRTPDTLIIEVIEGHATDPDGNGIITNTKSSNNYISYRNIDTLPGEAITTYCIYNPDSTYTDDIIYRIDITADGNIYLN